MRDVGNKGRWIVFMVMMALLILPCANRAVRGAIPDELFLPPNQLPLIDRWG